MNIESHLFRLQTFFYLSCPVHNINEILESDDEKQPELEE